MEDIILSGSQKTGCRAELDIETILKVLSGKPVVKRISMLYDNSEIKKQWFWDEVREWKFKFLIKRIKKKTKQERELKRPKSWKQNKTRWKQTIARLRSSKGQPMRLNKKFPRKKNYSYNPRENNIKQLKITWGGLPGSQKCGYRLEKDIETVLKVSRWSTLSQALPVGLCHRYVGVIFIGPYSPSSFVHGIVPCCIWCCRLPQ